MTLREEVLKYSGVINEEVLEEGKFGKAVALAVMIAALAFGGIKGAQTVKDYKIKSSISASTKYDMADYKSSASEIRLGIDTDYSEASKQSILNLHIYCNYALAEIDYYKENSNNNKKIVDNTVEKFVKEYSKAVSDSLENYIKNLEAQNSKIEKILNKNTYAEIKPIKINLDFEYNREFNNLAETSDFLFYLQQNLVDIISKTFEIDKRLIDILINGKREF